MAAMTDQEALDRKAQKLERELFRVKELNRQEAVRALYRTPEGRDYLRWLLELTGMPSTNPFSGDPQVTAFQCGVLSVGQRLMAHMVDTDPTLFVTLLKETSNAPRGSNDHDPDEPDLFGANGADQPARPEEPALYA